MNMSKVQSVRASIQQRLSLATEEICELFERTIAEYEEQLCRQQKLLDSVFKPEVRLHRADVQLLLRSKEKDSPEQDWNSSLDQEDPTKPPHIKGEQEELLTNQEGEQLQDLHRLGFRPVFVKSEEEDEEKLQISWLQQTEADGEDCEEPDPERHLTTDTDETVSLSDPVADDADFCMRSGEPQPGSNPLKNDNIPENYSEGSLNHKKHQKKRVGRKTGEKTFSCTVCDKKYTLKKSFTDHMRLHTEKRFSCPVCKRKFRWNAEILRHLRVHTGEKPFICSVCGKGFTGDSNLAAHMTIHTGEKPFSCAVCKANFRQQYALSRHMRLHAGERLFSCSVCSKKFEYKTVLANHMETHKEKTYRCLACDQRFSQVPDLIKHKCTDESSRRVFATELKYIKVIPPATSTHHTQKL